MSVEAATYISQLDSSLPASGDAKSEGDNHLRTIKAAIKATFPNVSGVVTASHTALNDAVSATVGAVASAAAAAVSAASAENSAVAATSAALVSGAIVWVSGTSYALGDVRYSPINFQTYRCKSPTSGTTDPSADNVHWILAVNAEVTLTGNEILSNKRLHAYYVIEKSVVNAAATGTVNLDISAATAFDLTLTGTTTLAVTNPPALSGETQSFVVKVTQGASAQLLNWFSGITWLTTGGAAPAAPAASKTIEYIITTSAAGVYQGRKGAST